MKLASKEPPDVQGGIFVIELDWRTLNNLGPDKIQSQMERGVILGNSSSKDQDLLPKLER